MVIRYIWRKCSCWGLDAIDSFWVEATRQEAKDLVFPFLSKQDIDASLSCAESSQVFVNNFKDNLELYPYCFLVSQNLGMIKPFFAYYPFSNQWNGYSPFEEISESTINCLNDLITIIIPESMNDEATA